MGVSWTVPLAVACICAFFLGLVLFPARLNRWSTFLLIVFTFSPAVMLGLERGNVDIAIFAVVCLALFLAEVSTALSLLVLMVAVLFKLFPAFGLGYLLERDGNSGLRWIGVGGAASVLYVVLTLPDMIRVYQKTGKNDDISYGVIILAQRIADRQNAFLRYQLLHLPASVTFSQLRLLFYGVVVLLLLVAGYLGLRNRAHYDASVAGNLRAFRVGAGIYVGTFLLGNNHDYRLMFLLLAVPLLADWSFRDRGRVVARLALILAFVSVWYLVISRLFLELWKQGATYAFLLDQASKWGLFACLVYLLCASLPASLLDRVALVLPGLGLGPAKEPRDGASGQVA